MNAGGYVLVVDDDEDDKYILNLAFEELSYNYNVVYTSNGQEAIDFLTSNDNKPLLILSDVNMPVMDGFQLKDSLMNKEALGSKNIPFIFLSTSAERNQIMKGYEKSIQGYFIKKNSFGEYKKMIQDIMDYWQISLQPERKTC